jgi:protein involved in polysaccharide export with SLBB domain
MKTYSYALTLFTACAALAFPASGRAQELATEAAPSANYVLTANDLISVKVFQEDDLTTSCRIAADGTVSLPLIGQVKVAGQSALDVARQIARSLDARFVVNPQVTVSVTSFAHRRFTMLGQIAKAGAYNLQFQESIDLLEAIGIAGGYTRMANPKKITVKRREGQRDILIEVNGKELASGGKGFRVLPGDTVTIGERLF